MIAPTPPNQQHDQRIVDGVDVANEQVPPALPLEHDLDAQVPPYTPAIAILTGTFPVKKNHGSLFASWSTCNVSLYAHDGLLVIVPTITKPELGRVIRLLHMQYDEDPRAAPENCIQVSIKGRAWLIQFSNEQQRQAWQSGQRIMQQQLLGICVLLLACTLHAAAAVFNISVNLPFLTPSVARIAGNQVKFVQANAAALLADIDPQRQHSFNLVYTPTNATTRNATIALLNAIEQHNIVAVIGDSSSATTTQFPYLFRTCPDDGAQGSILALFVRHMGWRTIAVISSSDAYGTSVTGTFFPMARSLNLTIATNQIYQPGQADYSLILDSVLNSGSQIILLAGVATTTVPLLRQARAKGMISNEFVWVAPESFGFWTGLALNATDSSLVDGMLFVTPRERGGGALAEQSIARFNQANPGESIPPSTLLLMDCVLAVARGILRIASDTSAASVLSRSYFPSLSRYFLQSFEGLSGPVEFDSVGNRKAYFQVLNWYQNVSTPVFDVFPNLTIQATSSRIRFFSGDSTVPPDQPLKRALVPSWDSPAGIGLGFGNIASIVIVVATWAYLFKARHIPSVKRLSFPFLTVICLGCVLVLVSNVVALGNEPTVGSCQASLWTFVLGLELVLASSAAKAYRMHKIFDNKVISAGNLGNKAMFMGLAAVLLGQAIILIVWAAVDAQNAVMVSGRTYFYYRCTSTSALFDQAMSGVTIAYNGVLLLALMVLAYLTRNIATNFCETKWLFFTSQNTLLSGSVVAVFALFDFSASALAATVIKQVAILYATLFAFGSLVGRIAIVVFAEQKSYLSAGAPVQSTAAKTSLGELGTMIVSQMGGAPTPRTTAGLLANASGNTLPNVGQQQQVQKSSNGVLSGVYAVKKNHGSLFSTWISSSVTLFTNEGLLSMIPTTSKPELGNVLRLSLIQYEADPRGLPHCVEVSVKGKSWTIQFSNDEERAVWVQQLATTSATSTRASASQKSSGKGTVAGSMSVGKA
ncbi:hypothetical protein BCR44DRAFT_1497611 [Catenaria anguillulae PL171]|uniref:G-protein coupled receptors family 3 profile domain-containing protein n=1 Tax=Catenaria anguillulae PL171 TaxID=765915 RepID=A0A1Y2HWA4_9FUNG|nr:hypothetical protein BCR44DRAFT_1497611 [Catenaria anguillulae PL171]